MNRVLGGTYINNIISLPGNYERLTFPKGARRVNYRWIHNRRFHTLSTTWKDFKTLQFVRGLRKTGIREVSRSKGQGIHQAFCTEDLTKYYQSTDDVDRGEHLRENGDVFSPKAQFKKWYKR